MAGRSPSLVDGSAGFDYFRFVGDFPQIKRVPLAISQPLLWIKPWDLDGQQETTRWHHKGFWAEGQIYCRSTQTGKDDGYIIVEPAARSESRVPEKRVKFPAKMPNINDEIQP